MMKLRLKNKDLQVQLDAISNGDFTKKLNSFGKIQGSIRIFFGEKIYEKFTYGVCAEGKLSIILTKDEIEEIVEYDPRKWNKYPEVTPPTGVPMRCEWKDIDGIVHRYVASYEHIADDVYYWLDDLDYEVDVDRFRPWNEPEDECKVEHEKDMHPDAIAARRYMGEEDEE